VPSPSTPFKPIHGEGHTQSTSEQNYPNPLSSANAFRTTIPFSAPAGLAIITITDASGRVVHSSEKAITTPGLNSFEFSGEQLPAGTYYYRIESPKGVTIVEKTMLLVK
jgi:flagellar hook assembly protein FlgD